MNIGSNKSAYIAATLAAVIFGFSFLFTKSALDNLDIFQLLGFRFLLAALFLSLLKVTGVISVNTALKDLKSLLPIAFFQPVLYFICETIGVNLTSASESGIIIALVPISITIFAVFILKERLSAGQWGAIAVSVAGVVLIVLAKGPGEGSGHLLGVLALVGACIAAGLYNVLSRKISAQYTPVDITFIMMWVGAIVFNVLGITNAVLQGTLVSYCQGLNNLNVIVGIGYLGILSSVGAFLFLNFALSKIEASKSAVFMNLTPVITVVAGVFLRGERFYPLQVAGAVLIMLGIWGTNRKSSR